MAWLDKAFKETAHYRTIEAIDPNERLLCVVKQHPIGILMIYVLSTLAFTVSIALISLLLPNILETTQEVYLVWGLIALFLSGVLVVMLLLSTYVYNQSRLTITDKNVMQIMQRSIVERKISHLSLANVEDVSSEQKGVIASQFDFGTIIIETAGEQANFKFGMCPYPNRVAKIILDAKDEFLKTTGRTGSFRNDPPKYNK